MATSRKAVQFLWLKSEAHGHTAELLIEQLRYMGVVSIVTESDESYVLQIQEPRGVEAGGLWADQNAERMQSFGINARVVKGH